MNIDGRRWDCSFCDKSHLEVSAMIAGDKARICDECIELCVHILEDKRRPGNAWWEQEIALWQMLNRKYRVGAEPITDYAAQEAPPT